MKDIELSNHLDESLEMLRALSEEGLVIVPAIPSLPMVEAAQKVCKLSESQVRKIYTAMISFADEEIPTQVN